MKNLSKHLGDPRRTPQSRPIEGREAEMHRGPAGGFVFKTGDWERLDRFLIIGTEGGTYYADERSLTIENAAVVRRCLRADASRVLARVIEVSEQGLAPKNDPAILALAVAFVALKGQHVPMLRTALQKVCRIGTHLFRFLEAVRGMRGGGRGLNGAVRAWLDEMPADRLALQMVKYRNRAGWTWRDVMRRFRPKPPKLGHLEEDGGPVHRYHLYAWAAGKEHAPQWLPWIIRNTEEAAKLSAEELAAFVEKTKLPWECIPPEYTTRKDVLGALFTNMPMMATVRQLSKLQTHGVLLERKADCLARLRDQEAIRKSRIHPVSLLLAAGAYELGRGRHLIWQPDPQIVDGLDDAFQLALKVAEPTGKKILVAIDSSGSMHRATSHAGIPLFKIAAAMALTYVRTDQASVVAFDVSGEACRRWWVSHPHLRDRSGIQPLALSERMRITDAMRAIEALGQGGGTDCSLPFQYALENDLDVDAFVVLTDNESWAGYSQHPSQALDIYRERKNPNAKVVWCAMTAGWSSLGLPDDPRCLGICGFDSSAPQLVGNFVAGRF